MEFNKPECSNWWNIKGLVILNHYNILVKVVSQILHVIMEPTLSFIKHILKDSFDFIGPIDTQCTVHDLLKHLFLKD